MVPWGKVKKEETPVTKNGNRNCWLFKCRVGYFRHILLCNNLEQTIIWTLHIFNDTQRYFVQLFKEPSLLFEEWSWDSPCTVDESFSEHQLIHIGGGFNNPGWVSLSTILLWERQHALAAHWRSSLKGAVRCTTHWNRPQTLIHTVTSSNVLF